MFETALTWSDLAFLAKGAGMTLAVTAVAVTAGTIMGIIFGVLRFQLGPYWALPLTFVLDVFRSVPLLIQLVLGNAFQSIAKLGWPPLRPPAWFCRFIPRPIARKSCVAASKRCPRTPAAPAGRSV